jgi:hypothetical protein
MVFVPHSAASERAARDLGRHDLRAGVVHSGQLREERRTVLSRFADGSLDVLAVPRVLDEGIDVPAADLAVIAGASRSRRQMIQRRGRVLRRKPDGPDPASRFCSWRAPSKIRPSGPMGRSLTKFASVGMTTPWSAEEAHCDSQTGTAATLTLSGSGVGKPSSAMPWGWNGIASLISCSTSARVSVDLGDPLGCRRRRLAGQKLAVRRAKEDFYGGRRVDGDVGQKLAVVTRFGQELYRGDLLVVVSEAASLSSMNTTVGSTSSAGLDT